MELWIVLLVEPGECKTAVKFYTEVFGGVQIHGRFTSDEQSPLLSAALKFGDTNVIVKEQLEQVEEDEFKWDELGSKKNTNSALCVVCDDDIQATIDKAISAGAFWEAEIREDEFFPGKHSSMVWDPFGFEWTIVGNRAAEAEIGGQVKNETSKSPVPLLDLKTDQKPLWITETNTQHSNLQQRYYPPAAHETKAKKGANFQMLGQLDEISKLVSMLKRQAEVELPVDIVIVDLDLVFEKKDEELVKSPKIENKLSLEDEQKRLWYTGEVSNKEINEQFFAKFEYPNTYMSFSRFVAGISSAEISSGLTKYTKQKRDHVFKERIWAETVIVQKHLNVGKMVGILEGAFSLWKDDNCVRDDA